jgi:transposase
MSKFSNSPVIGIDVAADFSVVAILSPNGDVYKKPFKIMHDRNGFEYLLNKIKEVEKIFQMNAATFMESTGIYHLNLLNFLNRNDVDTFTINPLITNSNKNFGIRKVKNDKKDALAIANLCKYQDIKFSTVSDEDLFSLKLLVREYYKLTDYKSNFKKKLSNDLRLFLPGYIDLFSDISSKVSFEILKTFTSAEAILSADKESIINILLKSKRGLEYADKKYSKLIKIAEDARIIGLESAGLAIKIKIDINNIENYQAEISMLNSEIELLINSSKISDEVVQNIELLQSIPGIGRLTAITIATEIGSIDNFANASKLSAFFGIDPNVKESGNFRGSRNHISKRGTRIGRRSLYAVALSSIRFKRDGNAMNPILLDYYKNNMSGKPKKVGLTAVMHKLMKYIFSILKNRKLYELRSPKLHSQMYIRNTSIQIA